MLGEEKFPNTKGIVWLNDNEPIQKFYQLLSISNKNQSLFVFRQQDHDQEYSQGHVCMMKLVIKLYILGDYLWYVMEKSVT